MLISCVIGVFFWPVLIPAIAFIVVKMFAFYFNLFAKMIEDENGHIILTKKSQRRITREIERYNQYKHELGETI